AGAALDARDAARPGDREDHGRLGEQPGERHLLPGRSVSIADSLQLGIATKSRPIPRAPDRAVGKEGHPVALALRDDALLERVDVVWIASVLNARDRYGRLRRR